MDDNDIDLMIILSMLKLRFETKQKLTIDNIHAKTNELSNSLLNGKAITDSIKRLRFQGHIKENLDILLLRSGIVFYYIEILQTCDEINEALGLIKDCLKRLEIQSNPKYDL
ncbi:hypothetical protein [Paenibacillus sp. FSL H7-0331]|uniref:hypothetical protein n=1 Tax=Paenibacillus sp. FSL H7-0331 TaxID=1920421 RepID=UPI00096F9ADE|nr:hypothetical protein [Paenibacillus sp. FSL H7-0331]OMF13665.1 hypothetical protein BK127_20795 [Paenibacillus sp. FSL H7-0331]